MTKSKSPVKRLNTNNIYIESISKKEIYLFILTFIFKNESNVQKNI